MLIAIISDIHDNEVNLEKCLAWCCDNKIEKIICCGDITNSETLEILSNKFLGEIFLVRGNADSYNEEEVIKYKNIVYGGETSVFEIAGFKVGLCHEPFLIDKILSKNKCNIIFYGHTHKPWIESREDTKIINPGTLGGVFTRATFAIWEPETGRIELKLLENI